MSQPVSNHPILDSLDALIDAMYRSVSGPKPGLDIETLRRIFLPQARMIRGSHFPGQKRFSARS